ncbi:lipoprotein insertase outer membrane protein LolB [Parashewanella hymeniacidonis]|uniref:lipoprotein insertase outer membrane protein LolB n=1 Tax=Parashewanella hymeniacidonis TaxID=2807618 RepID=UPI003083FCD6
MKLLPLNIRNFVLAFTVMLLGACTSLPQTTLLPTQVSSVQQAKAWELKGKLLVKTPQDKFSTHLFWLHEPNRDQLTLTTMLGTTVLSLDARPDSVTLTADGKTHTGNDAQRLLQRLTGWSIPVNQFPYWITGQIHQQQLITNLDSYGNPRSVLISLDGTHWSLTYKSWQQQSGANVPRLLQVKQPELDLKVQINKWQALAVTQ